MLGGLGTLVVVKRFAFFSEAVGHAALTGVAIGILLGEPYTGPYGSLFGYCLLFGVLLNYLRNRTGLAPDTLIDQLAAAPGGQGDVGDLVVGETGGRHDSAHA